MRTLRSLALFAFLACPAAQGLAAPLGGFVENAGQLEPEVRYYALGAQADVYFTTRGPLLVLVDRREADDPTGHASHTGSERAREERHRIEVRRHAIGVRFVNPSPALEIIGAGTLPGRHAFFVGAEPAGWRSDVRAFESVVYSEVWPGIDVVYRDDHGQLVYTIVTRPGADRSAVAFAYDGALEVAAARDSWRVETSLGTLEDRRPAAQRAEGSFTVEVRPRAESVATEQADADESVRARAGLRYATFLGGERDEAVYALALDSAQRPVVAGATRSADFPSTVGALDPTYDASFDGFVAKLEQDGSALVWSTFLGAPGDDRVWALVLDAADRPVVAGITTSTAFPTAGAPYDPAHNGVHDAFVAKLAADGSALVWSTFLGGSDSEWDVSGLALDAAERAVVAGSTRSADFPTTAGAWDASLAGLADAFVARLAADGSALVASTLLGGGSFDVAEDLALDSTGRAVVVGHTQSDDFPVTPGAFQTVPGSAPASRDAFVAKLSVAADDLVFGTFLGGDAEDLGFAVAIDGADRPIVTGATESSNFPTTPGSYRRTPAGIEDAFVAALSADGAALAWGTYFGGASSERGLDLALDRDARPVVVGPTCSEDLPVPGLPFDASFNGPCDAFLAKLAADGSFAVYGSYLGGWYDETAFAVAVEPSGRVVIGGETISSDFPSTAGVYDPAHNSPDEWYDAFVLAVTLPAVCTSVTETSGPEIRLARAGPGGCDPAAPLLQAVDVIEGRLEQLGPLTIGNVEAVACDALEAIYGTDSVPSLGLGLFQLVRYAAGGAYTDGAGPGLVGTRTPASGDCP